MKRVATAVVLIPLVLVAVFRAPLWTFAILVGLIALWTAQEYLNLLPHYGVLPFRWLTLLLVATCFLVPLGLEGSSVSSNWLAAPAAVAMVALYGAPFLFLIAGFRRESLAGTLPAAALSLFALPYVALPLLSIVFIRLLPAGAFFLALLLILVWAGDIAAYYVGRTFGRHLMAPRISPKKTWEGAAASIIASIALAIGLAQSAPRIGQWLSQWALVQGFLSQGLLAPPSWVPLVLAVAINVAAQLGDLAESVLKRGAGVKDSGGSLPGHGGMLDRIDALLFAAPVAMVVFVFTYSYFIPPS
ncbi:MAG TPA: phosphatidate cytidylyltransferase [Terriglobales bacterium]|nr:phosphatidate cytidylyltransferase [Terriglobales bacterium]